MLANVLPGETVSGEEGARGRDVIYSLHTPRIRSSYACILVIVGLWNV